MPSLCDGKIAPRLISCCGVTFIMIIIGIIAAPLTVQSLMSSSSLDLRELNVTIVNSNQIEQGVIGWIDSAPVVEVDSRLSVGIWASW